MNILNKNTFLFKYIIGFTVLIIIGVFSFYFLFLTVISDMVLNQKNQIINNKKVQIKEIVTLTTQHVRLEVKRLSKSNMLTVEDIQGKILQELSLLKYAKDGYIFVVDKNNKILSHPESKYIGQDFTKRTDNEGVLIIPPLVNIAVTKGEGYHNYSFIKLKSSTDIGKVTYAKYFNEWEWIICSGLYLDDAEVEANAYSEKMHTYLVYALILGIIVVIIFFVIWIFVFIKNLFSPLNKISKILDLVAIGNFTNEIKEGRKDEIGTIYSSLERVMTNLKKVTNVSAEIGKGNLAVKYELANDKDELGKAIVGMRDSLILAGNIQKKSQEEESQRNWATNGMAKFGDILRQNTNQVGVLADSIIKNLVQYLDANQGGLFILNNQDNKNITLDLISAYAYEHKKTLEASIPIGEGLIGSCAIEKKTIYITDVPDSYINLATGLGEANPTSILIVPLRIDEDIYGIVELASFNEIHKFQIEFMEKIGESIASTLSTVKINETTALLLEESQQQSEKLASQEEEMRQNLEEMQATQEESNRREAEISGIIGAINNVSLVSEFDMEGNFININDKFMTLLGANSKGEIIGRNHKEFYGIAKNVEEYEEFRNKIRSGQTITIKNKVDTIQNESIWLNETYSSILDADGNIVKVINISTEITDGILLEQKIVQQNAEMKAKEEKMLVAQNDMNIKEQDIDYLKQTVRSLIYKLEIDKHNNIIDIDEMFSEKLDYNKDALIGKNINKIITDIDKLNKTISNIENNETETITIKLKTKEEKEIIYKLALRPVYDLEGEYKKTIILIPVK